MTAPSDLKREAQSILAEIPHAFIQLANSDSHATDHMISSLRDVHNSIATAFGEPRPRNIGVLQIASDLQRWISVWVWHPHADYWVSQLRHILHIANNATDVTDARDTSNADIAETNLRWVDKHDAVCPNCLTLGHLEYQEASWDHRCTVTDTVWQWREYRDAIKQVLADVKGRAA